MNIKMCLRITSQPPSTGRRNVTLSPPLVLELDSQFDCGTGRCQTSEELSKIWIYLALVDETQETVIDALAGTLAKSPRERRIRGGRHETSAVLVFDDLKIREAGRYRIRVTLFRMDEPSRGANAIQQLCSEVIRVRK